MDFFKHRRSMLLLCVLASTNCARASQVEPPALASGLGAVTTIYLGSVGTGSDGELAYSTLQSELRRRGPFALIEDSLAADAVLSGSLRVRRPQSASDDFFPFGELALRDRARGDTLWTHRYVERAPLGVVRRGQPPGEHIVTMVLQFVDRLHADATAAKRRAAAPQLPLVEASTAEAHVSLTTRAIRTSDE